MPERQFRCTFLLLLHFVLLLFSIQTRCGAQTGYAKDFLVLHSGDSLYGSVQYINENGVSPAFYKKIRLTDTQGKRKKFKRKAVAGFRINGDVYESFWLSQSSDKAVLLNPRYDIDRKGGEQYFLKRRYKGALSHYQMEWIEQGDAALMSMDLLKKEDDHFFIRATQGIFGLKTSVLKNYFTDCPELRNQIMLRQFNAVWEIVDFYNRNCGYK